MDGRSLGDHIAKGITTMIVLGVLVGTVVGGVIVGVGILIYQLVTK